MEIELIKQEKLCCHCYYFTCQTCLLHDFIFLDVEDYCDNYCKKWKSRDNLVSKKAFSYEEIDEESFDKCC